MDNTPQRRNCENLRSHDLRKSFLAETSLGRRFIDLTKPLKVW